MSLVEALEIVEIVVVNLELVEIDAHDVLYLLLLLLDGALHVRLLVARPPAVHDLVQVGARLGQLKRRKATLLDILMSFFDTRRVSEWGNPLTPRLSVTEADGRCAWEALSGLG